MFAKSASIFLQCLLICRGASAFAPWRGPERPSSMRPAARMPTRVVNTRHGRGQVQVQVRGSIAEGGLDEPNENDDASPILCSNAIVTRRASLLASVAGVAASVLLPRNPALAASATDVDDSALRTNDPPAGVPSITVPLQYQPNLSAYTVSYRVGSSGTKFGAIVDTGSPFLLVPQNSEESCRPGYRWGCFRPEESEPSGLGPTVERFDGNEGSVEWREGRFSFDVAASDAGSSGRLLPSGPEVANAATSTIEDDPEQSALFPRSLMTFGVISESLMDGPGGIFLGLVKNADGRIRPSFLGQTDVSAFAVDLRGRDGAAKSLTLYGGAAVPATSTSGGPRTASAAPSPAERRGTEGRANFGGSSTSQSAIPLVRDLNRRYGDPTVHYVGVASAVTVNGSDLATTSRRDGRVYCIFDTGCSGMSVSPGLFDERYAAARANRERSLWGSVDVDFKTESGGTVTLSAERPITTPLGSDRPWGRRLDGHLVVLGLAFLDGRRMTVDIDGDRMWFDR